VHHAETVAPPGASPTRAASSPSLRAWLLTTEPRRIALLYLATVTGVFLAGALAAGLLRLELLTPPGDLVSADAFNRTFSLHGIAMVWFFLVPAIPAVLGTFALPRMLGAEAFAFPRLVRTSWLLFVAGIACLGFAAVRGGVDTGWSFAMPFAAEFARGAVVATVAGIVLATLASLLLALTFLVTIHRERAPQVTWAKLPLFAWSLYASSWILLLSAPLLITALVALVLERTLGLGLFDPALGGDPMLFRRLFWLAARPALYAMVLPALGVASEVVAVAAGRPVRGRRVVAACFGAIAVLGFFTWGVHLSTGGESPLLAAVSSLMGMILTVPFGLVLLHWLRTLRGRTFTLTAPMAWTLGFFVLLVAGGLSGVGMVMLGVDVHLHGTLFVIGHFHLLTLGVLMAFLAGLHLWWPELTGRQAPGSSSRAAALLAVTGVVLTFAPQIWLGVLGLPRRQWSYPSELQVYQVLSTAGATLLAVGLLIPAILFAASLRRGAPSPATAPATASDKGPAGGPETR